MKARRLGGIVRTGICVSFGVGLTAVSASPSDLPLQIPLSHAKTSYSDGNYDALGILIGVNGGPPRLFQFDTGSDEFNLQLNAETPGVRRTPGTEPRLYGYGDGTYGYMVQEVQFDNLSYYDPTDLKQPVVTIGGGYVAGQVVDVVYAKTYTDFISRKTATKSTADYNGTPLYADLDIRNRIRDGVPGETPPFYGVFGASDTIQEEIKSSPLGGRTKSGYLVSANANMGNGNTPGCAPCLTLHLNPSIRAQFTAITPWGELDFRGYRKYFPQSGAHGSAEFEGAYKYTISINMGRKKKAVHFQGPILLDTGTAQFLYLSEDKVYNTLRSRGLKIDKGGSAFADFKIEGFNDKINNLEFVNIDVLRMSQENEGDGLVVGLPFFQANSVIYDLEYRATAYSPYYVTASDFSTDPREAKLHLSKATADIGSNGWLGLAGTISGSGGFVVEKDAVVRMTGSNTYTGVTHIKEGGFLYLAGPGELEQSSALVVDGIFDMSQKGRHHPGWGVGNNGNDARIRNLVGSGEIHIGAHNLILTAADGHFNGTIWDYDGDANGLGGGLVIAGGRLTLGGQNSYSGLTEIAEGAELTVAGSLAGDVRVLGKLTVTGEVLGRIMVERGGSLGGSGKAGGVSIAEGGDAVSLQLVDTD